MDYRFPHLNLALQDPVLRLRDYIEQYRREKDYVGFEATVMRNLNVVAARRATSAEAGMLIAQCDFRIECVRELCSPTGNMHGGAIATLADMTTTMSTAPIAEEKWWKFSGVSRTLNVTFLKPIPLGTSVRVDCTVRSLGKRLAVMQCTMKDEKDGRLLALAEHGKVTHATNQFPKTPVEKL